MQIVKKLNRLHRKWKRISKRGFIAPESALRLGQVLIVVGIVFLILHYVTDALTTAGFNSSSEWYSSWSTIVSFAKTGFLFLGLALLVGGAMYIVAIIQRAFS